MRNWGCSVCLTSAVGAFWALGVEAADYRRHDGVHRIEKEAQITQAPGLARRAEAQCATTVTVETPTAPTALPTVNAGEDNDQAVLKYFPSSIPKVSPTSLSDDDNGDKGGLSTGALAGIIAGSVAFLIIVLVAAFIIIRHLNKVVAAVATPKTSDKSNGSNSQPRQTRGYKTADSAIDELSIDPLIHPSLIPPRPRNPGPDSAATSPFGLASAEHSSNEPTPGGNGYHAVPGSGNTSRHASFDAVGNRDDYFSAVAAGEQHQMSHISRLTGSTRNRSSTDSHGTYTHVRNYSNASEGSDGSPGVMIGAHPTAELEATPYVPELPSSPSSVVFPRDERRRSSGSIASVPSRPPVAQRQSGGPRIRSDSLGQSNLSIVNEEMHGFYGPSEHLVGQTDSHRPGTRGSGNRQPNAPMEPPRPVAEEP
ncbi:hypothetical protein FMUND_11602 [Fusarium mundagurra]|uniref:Uncharacterized protein n=1 Tax=Fusarium mundagurra TaxID=1567541 RepID=A0A8H5Y859_9HYPO|nr:hypothetical protein FMUND_11602 [Fusarium mundagurra]